MWPIPLTSMTAAMRTLNAPNVSSASRDLALAALCFLQAAFLFARSRRRFFGTNVLFLTFSYRCFLPRFLPTFFQRVGYSTLNTPRLLHHRTLLLTRVCPSSIPTLLASSPTFSGAALYQLCCRRHGCRGKRFRFVGLHHHQSMVLAGLHCQHRRVLASIDVMKGHRFERELYR